MRGNKGFLLISPFPQKINRFFKPEQIVDLDEIITVKNLGDEDIDYDLIDSLLPDTIAIIGQFDLPKTRLEKAKQLKVIFNSEGNFAQNIDYEYCFQNNIYVLNCGEAFALPVAEMALGFALDLARGITKTDKEFRNNKENYLAEACKNSVLLSGSSVGLIGFGFLGKYLIDLLRPFNCNIQIFDPWVPDSVIRKYSAVPVSLDDVLSSSKFIFVLAGVTKENEYMLNREKLSKISRDAFFILMSRAAIVKFEDLVRCIREKRFAAAVDVFPTEPLKDNHEIRKLDNVLLSSHRAGAIPQAYEKIGNMIIEDLKLILKGLPPVIMQQARRETVGKLKNKPSA